MKGLLGIAGPLILGSIVSGALRRRGRSSGMFGNLGGLFGNAGLMRGGGLGSLIGMLSGGRGIRNTGGLFGRLLHNRF